MKNTTKLPIIYYGDPLLRTKSQLVPVITDEVRTFIHDLIETMKAHKGQGIAAIQVGKAVSIFVVCIPTVDDETRTFTYPEPSVFINAKLSNPSEEIDREIEGCLSIPKIWAPVERPERITVTYMTLKGNTVTETYDGEFARAIMHENDHVNGVLFTDRLSKRDRQKVQKQLDILKKQWKSRK